MTQSLHLSINDQSSNLQSSNQSQDRQSRNLTCCQGNETVLLIHRILSQLSGFSVPSNNFDQLPPDPLNVNSLTRSGGFVVVFRRMSSTCSCREIWKKVGFFA